LQKEYYLPCGNILDVMTSPRLANHFLIAMPKLADPNFFQTVTLVCEHNEEGALGIVINRPTDLRLSELFDHLGLTAATSEIADVTVYAGGPVQMDRGFVLHQPLGRWETTLKVSNEIGLTTSRDILAAIATGEGPEKSLITLGYAGWGPGQLEHEIASNAWLTVSNDASIVFDIPADKRWQSAATKLGIDLNLLAGDAGHA
jgi:putative transcriptional regulator